MRALKITRVDWPVKGIFRISRSALSVIPTVQVSLVQEGFVGRAECRPYGRYNETCESVTEQIETLRTDLENGMDLETLQSALPAGAARNAVDCALWDLRAKMSGRTVWDLLTLPEPRTRQTAYTLSIDTPENMAKAAKSARDYTLLKIKITSETGLACAQAVLKARPDIRLIIDANEALGRDSTAQLAHAFGRESVALIEQPLPNAQAFDLPDLADTAPPICADESLHTADDLPKLWAAGYRAVNVKLDKCGGLTEGIKVMRAAKAQGFTIMAGCMVGSSLAMAPMMILESFADILDLDGPLLLSEDMDNGLHYSQGTVAPPTSKLWG